MKKQCFFSSLPSSFSFRQGACLAFGIVLLALAGCKKEKTAIGDSVPAVFTEVRDIDGDGTPEMVIGFDREAVRTLPNAPVVLEGIFLDKGIRFESDGFFIQE